MEPSRSAKPRKSVRYRSRVPLTHDDGAPIPAEWQLHCPNCEYDLTGLTDRRCPECGRRFDPHEIWINNRIKSARLHLRTPAYVPYTVLVLCLLLTMQAIRHKPILLLPLAALPAFELLAHYFRWDAAGSRSIVMTLSVIASITMWSML